MQVWIVPKSSPPLKAQGVFQIDGSKRRGDKFVACPFPSALCFNFKDFRIHDPIYLIMSLFASPRRGVEESHKSLSNTL